MHDEQGSGLLGTVFGVGIFLLLLLLAVQVLTHLYATSVVEAAAYDAVQSVSGSTGGDPIAAEANARTLLGDLSETTVFDWDVGESEVLLRVTAERRRALPRRLAEPLGLDVVEREFRMRVEGFR